MRIRGLLLALLPGIAAAWDDQTPIAISALSPPAQVRWVASTADDGFVAVVQHRNSIVSFDRYAADGSRLSRVFEPETSRIGGGFYESARLQDFAGGTLVTDRRCAMAVIDDLVRWRTTERPQSTTCFLPATTPSGALWLSYNSETTGFRLSRHDAAGRRVFDQPFEAFLGSSNPVADAEEGAYIAGTDRPGVSGLGVVLRLRADGSIRWRWQSPVTAETANISWLLPRADGGVVAIGASDSDALTIASINSAGQRTTQRVTGILRGSQILGAAGDSEARLGIIALKSIGSFTSLFIPGAALPFDLPVGFECVPSSRGCALRVLDDGEVELPMRSVQGTQPARLLRVSRSGLLLSDRSIPLTDLSFAVPGIDEHWWVLSGGNVRRVAADGTPSAIAIEPAALSLQLLGEFQRGDVRLVALADGGNVIVARLNAAGGAVWQREFSGSGRLGLPWSEHALMIADSAACFRDERPSELPVPIRCLRLNDGATLLEVPVNATIGAQFAVFANGTLASLDRNFEGSAEVRRWRITDARPLPPVILPPLRTTANDFLRLRADRYLGASMVVVGRNISGAPQAAWFDNDDVVSRAFALPQLPIEFLVDGQYLALIEDRISGTARRLFLRALDTAMDRQQMNQELDAAYDGSGQVARLIIGNGNRFVSLSSLPTAPTQARILSVTPDWRTIIWRKQDRAPAIGYLTGSDRLLLARDEGAALAFVLLDTDGDRVDARTLPCETGYVCWTNLNRQGEFGDNISVAFDSYQSNDGRQLRSGTVRLGSMPDVPVGQNGLAGPWFHPGIPGQGFLISYIPGANLIFAPWFTYRGAPYGDQSQLAWYYLQGSAAAGATSADLEIVRNTGGRFAAPPITQAEVVGRAELRLTDCDRATLSYTFNANVEGGRSASMPLERLGPRLQPCLRVDGTTQSPPTTIADNNGFSRRQAGAWFEPATSGQGLMFEVQPAREGDPGFVFGAWFTYDIPPGNDAVAQDWFSLQAPIGTASDGRIELPIVRVIGGELNRIATQNAFRVGTATLTFNGCDRAVFAFQFETGELAAEHSGRSGTQQLQRAGGCGPLD